MKPIRFLPARTQVPFMRFFMFACFVSGTVLLASFLLMSILGLNYGIDFRGGVLVELQTKTQVADLKYLRSTLNQLDLGEVELQGFGAPNEVLVRIEAQPGGDDAQQVVFAKIKEALEDTVIYRRMEIVGPKVSGEIVRRGVLSVVLALSMVLIYIWLRFEWQFAIGTIVALMHDIILTIGFLSFTQVEFGLPIIAALLTIVGYSLNDTVVVFDRVRENLRRYRKMPLDEVLDLSINQTLSRTILTSGTTLIALLSLYLLGGQVIRGFTIAMILGVVIGTYSSIFIASPVLLLLNVKRTGNDPVEKPGEKER